jgi:hypothetical protein
MSTESKSEVPPSQYMQRIVKNGVTYTYPRTYNRVQLGRGRPRKTDEEKLESELQYLEMKLSEKRKAKEAIRTHNAVAAQ